ncbi:MAG: peptide-methionine (R)-S-oxide reductase MsrB [Pararhodobacter sp.]|nr:peptide-methionine (R)-S-oxide reductase MsrB [Pararhodobacter sp.]
MFTRRHMLLAAGIGLLTRSARAARTGFEIDLAEAEWRDRLSPAQFAVLRQRSTEHAWTNHLGNEASPLLNEARAGTYNCGGCGLGVYRSEVKYDSDTGWPSFWDAMAGAVLTYDDSSFFMRRTGLQCRRCGGHLGHLFDDGPQPTGQRHCINGLALTFTPDATGVKEGFPVARQ